MKCHSAFIVFTLSVISFTITKSEISSIPNSPDRVLLTLPTGESLIGLEATTSNGRQFHAFLGVPYAQPPVEALRFERPLPYSSGGIGKVHDCTTEKPICSHYVLKTHKAPGCGLVDSIRRLKKQMKNRKNEKRQRNRPSTTVRPINPPVTINTPFAPFMPTQQTTLPPQDLQLSDRFSIPSVFQRFQNRNHHHHHHHHRPVYNDTDDNDIIRIKTRVHVVDEDYHDDDYDDLYDENDEENYQEEEFVEQYATTTALPPPPTAPGITNRFGKHHTHEGDRPRQMPPARLENFPTTKRPTTTRPHSHRHHHDHRNDQESPQRIHLVTRIHQQDSLNPQGNRGTHRHNNHKHEPANGEYHHRHEDGTEHIHLVTRIHKQDPEEIRHENREKMGRYHSHSNGYGGELEDLERPAPTDLPNSGRKHSHEPRWRERTMESQQEPKPKGPGMPTSRFGKHHSQETENEEYYPRVHYPHYHDREEIIEVQKPRIPDEDHHHHHHSPHSHEDREETVEIVEPRNNQKDRSKLRPASRFRDEDNREEVVIERPAKYKKVHKEDMKPNSGSTKVKTERYKEDPETIVIEESVVLDDEDEVVSCEAVSGNNTSSGQKNKNGKVSVCCETYTNEELNLKNGTRCRPRRRTQRQVPRTPSANTPEEDTCGHAHGSEDCLYLNIYAPVFNDDEIPRQLPILVYVPASPATVTDHRQFPALGIHGADRLVEQGIIVVVVTGRRTGALGYLCTPSGPAGNQAAADVLAALRWVNQNAVSLNGDPNRITAWGDGDGAVLVHLAQIHTDIQRPFNSVVLTSGATALAPWATAHKPADTFRYLALKHLAILGDDRKRMDKLRRANHQKLQKYAAWIEYEKQLFGPGPWAAGSAFASCVEHPAARTPTETIIPTYSHEKILLGKAADTPMLIIHPDRKQYQLPSKKFKFWFGLRAVLKPKKLVPEDMHVEAKEKRTVASKIRHHYLLHRTTRKLKEAYLNYLIDSMYIRPTLKTAVLQARISKVWLARVTGPIPQTDAQASSHLLPPGRASFNLVNRVLGSNAPAGDSVSVAIANFVTRNDPGWLPVQANTTNQLACANLGHASSPYQPLVDYQHPDLHHLTFWDRLYDTYGYRPFNTY